jgi:prepilin-type N-terminal cleavage/methylation domain-containing protein
MKKRHYHQGFTLIELLAVLALVGILSVSAVYSYSISRSKSRDSVRIIDMKQLIIALEAYYDDHNFKYPDCNGACDNTDDWQSCLAVALKPYLELPSDPLQNSDKTNYCYAVSSYDSSHMSFNRVELSFVLENEKKGIGKYNVSDNLFYYKWRIQDYQDNN